MRMNIVGRKYKVYNKLEEIIDKKFEKLGKYFSDDITVNVVLSQERGKDKVEATINAKGAVFRSEVVADDVQDAIDKVVDKLSSQMSRFKGKLQKRYNDNKALKFEFLPEADVEKESKLVKTKSVKVIPMTPEEAVLEMEMVGHDFFLFLNEATDTVSAVYKRKDGDYGLLETE